MTRFHRTVRTVTGIKAAHFIPTPSWTKSTGRGSAAAGRAYERRVARELQRRFAEGKLGGASEVICGPWIEYADANGKGICQPDALVIYPDFVLVIEVKLRQNDTAKQQIERLYSPLAEHLYNRPTRGMEVFKYPTRRRTAQWCDISHVDFSIKSRYYYYWHWLG